MFRNLLVLTASSFALAACQPQAAAPISEDEAAKVLEGVNKALTSMDTAQFDGLYADGFVAFDTDVPGLITDKAEMSKINVGFAAMKVDGISATDHRIQPLGPDLFVDSGTYRVTSTDGPVKAFNVRYTDIYQKQADGSWKVITEHLSNVPEQAEAKAE